MSKTFAQKLFIYLKGGDDAKLLRFDTKLRKFLAKQQDARKDEIENLTEKLSDAKDSLNDTVLSVELDRIQNADAVESYCRDYTQKVLKSLDEIDELTEKIKTKQEEIARFDGVLEAVEAAIVTEVPVS